MGRWIGDYRLLALLGEGGHGEVYRAVHRDDPGQPVALKVVRPALLALPGFRHALRRECRILARLQHPGVVRLRDHLEVDGRPVLVMDLLEGTDLHALQTPPRRLPWAEVDAILLGALDALAHAHAHGVVHRDIKPANLFRAPDGQITLTDFGIASLIPSSTASSFAPPTRGLKGTFAYMAPERFHGTSTPGGDVYALGLVAWELLAGRRACPEGDLPHQMRWHLEEGPPPLADEGVLLPPWLAALLQAMTCPDPDVRPQDAGQTLRLRQRLQAPPPAARPEKVAPQGSVDLVPLLGVAPQQVPEVVAYAGLAAPLLAALVGGLGVPWRIALAGLAVGWSGLLWRRRAVLGGGLWAILWVPPAAALATWGPPQPVTLLLAAAICAATLASVRRHRWPLSVLEVTTYLLGLGCISLQLWQMILGRAAEG